MSAVVKVPLTGKPDDVSAFKCVHASSLAAEEVK